MATVTVNPINNEDIVLDIPLPNIMDADTETEINFDFIKNEDDRIMIETAYNAVNQLELWDYLRCHCGSFMFSTNKNVDRIYNKIEELGYCGHSGASFGLTLQTIKYIADHGFEEFKRNYLA